MMGNSDHVRKPTTRRVGAHRFEAGKFDDLVVYQGACGRKAWIQIARVLV